MDSKKILGDNHKRLQRHEMFTLAAVFIVGILLGSFVFAGPSGSPPAQCRDHIDNDGDTRIDFPNDPGCSNKKDKSERGTIPCDDGIDNDGDARIDYPNDLGCSSPSDSSELSALQCDDGIDNGDADSLKDYPNDLGCLSPSDSNEVDGQCDDLADNDNDTATDYPNDPGCTGFSDVSERGTAQCDDGLDNDGDGKIDYPNDVGCTSPSDGSEADTTNSCIDSDGGIVIGIKGVASGYNNNQPFSYVDYCLNSNTLVEYYCSGVYYVSHNQNCNPTNSTNSSSVYCIDGACI